MSEVNSVVSSANTQSTYGVGQHPEGTSAVGVNLSRTNSAAETGIETPASRALDAAAKAAPLGGISALVAGLAEFLKK